MLYNLFLLLYRLGISITSLWNAKAKAWITGREHWEEKLLHAVQNWKGKEVYWMHCASLGEFEQGRPLLEAIRLQNLDCKILLTFFSPSGYEIRKGYTGADFVAYLPMDGRRNAKQFLEIVEPSLALFVKYEFWHYFLKELSERKIKAILVSGAFRKDQVFFKWYGGFFRRMLKYFDVLTVQDEASKTLLHAIGFRSVITGDTRYDRVVAIAAEAEAMPKIELFSAGNKLVIAGSTWPGDEQALKASLKIFPVHWKLILAPHEIHVGHLRSIKNLFGNECVFYSELERNKEAKVLVIDNIGMLSNLYRYGEIACIGGGFDQSGIHNILEPAVFGLPVIFGPFFEKFSEAREMVGLSFAFPAADTDSYSGILQKLMEDPARGVLQERIKQFVFSKTGATDKILKLLEGLK